jgi:hypothetical protein
MVDVDALGLSSQLPGHPAVMNLGLLIWLGLGSYGEALSDFASANPGQVHDVVLLVTPRKLTLEGDVNQEKFWRQIRGEYHESHRLVTGSGGLPDWLGIHVLRQNLLSHLLTAPLRGQGAGTEFFGFSSQVDAYMTSHHGSLVNFGTVSRCRRLQPMNLAPAAELEAESHSFRAKVPSGAKLLIGLTPVAQSYCSPEQERNRAALLSQWDQWIKADIVLTNLPSTLPDVLFADEGHLNASGQKRFTSLLARVLAPVLESSQQ